MISWSKVKMFMVPANICFLWLERDSQKSSLLNTTASLVPKRFFFLIFPSVKQEINNFYCNYALCNIWDILAPKEESLFI